MIVDSNGVEIEVIAGDIVRSGAEALVNAANNHFWMGSGVAGALKRAGGEGIEQEAMAQGPKRVGECVVTSGGHLSARYVIHAAVMGQDLRTDAGIVSRATESSLEAARRIGVASVALPAFGTGVGGLDPVESAGAMISATTGFAREGSGSIRRITFVLFSPELKEAFAQALEAATQ
jgi:O-acetyl-ADP-ribose deacetylase (regulator of RNase III)